MVAIIGGGIAGLYLAWLLGKRGISCRVFEAEERLGGLLAPIDLHGRQIDGFYHHFFLGDRHARRLCEELELDISWHKSRPAHLIDGRLYPLSGLSDLLALPGVPKTALLGLLRLGWDAWLFSHHSQFDRESALDYLRRTQSPALFRLVFEPLLRCRFGSDTEQVSAFWFLDRLGSRMKGRSGHTEKLGFPAGGFYELVRRLAQRLEERSIAVHSAWLVTRLTRRDNQVLVETTGGQERFSACVSTIPLPRLRQLLPEEQAAIIPDIKYQACQCLALALAQPLSEYYWINFTDPSANITGLIEHSNLIPPASGEPHLLYIPRYFSAGENKLPDFQAYAETTLRRLFPAFTGQVLAGREVYTTYAQPLFSVGHLARRPRLLEPFPGLYATDSSLDEPYQTRSIDGALRRAHSAAAWVRERLP